MAPGHYKSTGRQLNMKKYRCKYCNETEASKMVWHSNIKKRSKVCCIQCSYKKHSGEILAPLYETECQFCEETNPLKMVWHRGTKKRSKVTCKECHTKNVKKIRRNKKQELVAFLGGGCSVCGYKECLGVLEFHHLDPETKDPSAANIIDWTLKRAKKELKNCICLCTNHHREAHKVEKKKLVILYAPEKNEGCLCQYCGETDPAKMVTRKGKEKRKEVCKTCSGLNRRKDIPKLQVLFPRVPEYKCKYCYESRKNKMFIDHGVASKTVCVSCNSELNRIKREQRKKELVEYKGGCCVQCSYNEYMVALDFHHVNPEEKLPNFDGYLRAVSIERAKKEVDKCLLLCSNCHGEFHYYEKELTTT